MWYQIDSKVGNIREEKIEMVKYSPHSRIPEMIWSRYRVALLISMHDDKAIRFY